MLAALTRPQDFARVMAGPVRARSAHFVSHHLPGVPGTPVRPAARGRAADTAGETVAQGFPTELSTAVKRAHAPAVDDPLAPQHWLGLVVPKRHAKRAVTRNLIKRQMRTLMQAHASALPPGLWVLRLRRTIDRQAFASPASDALRCAVRAELSALLSRAAQAGGA